MCITVQAQISFIAGITAVETCSIDVVTSVARFPTGGAAVVSTALSVCLVLTGCDRERGGREGDRGGEGDRGRHGETEGEGEREWRTIWVINKPKNIK